MFVEKIETKEGIVDAFVLGFLVSLLLAGLIAAGSATEHEIRAPEYSLDSGLLAYYPFNGNANDESGNGHHGTVYGATLTEDRLGNPNEAYLFDNPTTIGTNRIVVSDENGFLGGETLESLSMSAWFLPFQQSDECSYILRMSSPDCPGHLHFSSDGQVCFTLRTLDIGIFNQVISAQVSSDRWHHAVGTWNGSVMKLYVDGCLTAEAPFPWNLSKTPIGDGNSIGANPCPDPNNPAHVCSFNGKIDEVRVYNHALTAEEIKAQYDEEKPEELPDLTLSPSDITLSHPYHKQGEEMTITGTIHNSGDADAKNVIVQFFDGSPDKIGFEADKGKLIDSKLIPFIPANTGREAQIDWICTSGFHDICIFVDPVDSILESDEENNAACKTVDITKTSFVPSVHGFNFPNWEMLSTPPWLGNIKFGAYCLGISYASLYYYYHDKPIPYTGSRPPEDNIFGEPGEFQTYWCIATYQSFMLPGFIDGLASIISGEFNIHQLHDHQYQVVKERLENTGPTVLLLYGSGVAHAVVAYEIIDLGREKRIYVYDPNYPTVDSQYLALFEVVDGLDMTNYYWSAGGKYFRFTCISPFMNLPIEIGRRFGTSMQDKITPSGIKSHTVLIDPTATEAICEIYWQGSNLNITLITPNGTLIDPSVAISNPNITFVENATFEFYAIQNPEPGNWTMKVTAIDVPPEGENYTVAVYLATNLTLSLKTDKYRYDPSESLIIRANLTNNGTPVTGASVQAEVRNQNCSDNLTLFDDGTHGDGQANDGVYSNNYTNTSAEGTYTITVTATGTIDGYPFVRERQTSVLVQLAPDLVISNITFSNHTPSSGDEIVINATIQNIGDVNISNFAVSFYHGAPFENGTYLGSDTISTNLTIGGTTNASLLWTAKSGSHNIFVKVRSLVLEKNESNNIANKTICVTPVYKLSIIYAGTDKLLYAPTEDVMIYCIIENANHDLFSPDIVYIVIENQTFDLSELSTGFFTAIFDQTSQTGIYEVTIYANKTGYDNDAIELSFEVDSDLAIFDTDSPANPYPSIHGVHNGTITPSYDLNITKMYTYSCSGTGGHTEYVAFFNATTGIDEIARGTRNGYQGSEDYRYIEFESPFVLRKNETYNYTIRTGSYPQIIHEPEWNATGGKITCTSFVDINGQQHEGWIPAIRLE